MEEHEISTLAPIALFVYNRIEHTKRTIDALRKNTLANKSELYIFSDGPKNDNAVNSVAEIRIFLKTIVGFKKITIIERDENYGLAKSIIEGASDIINEYEKIIVLEDDLLTSQYFLDYMNRALNIFKNRDDIYSITGFSFSEKFMSFPPEYNDEIFLNIRPMSWSWATWKDRWKKVDWEINDYNTFMQSSLEQKQFNKGGTDLTRMLKNQMKGKISSWYIRWTYNAYKQNKLTVYPRISYVNNIGHDITGTHCVEEENEIYSHTEVNTESIKNIDNNISLNPGIVNNFNKGFNTNYWRILQRKLKKLLYKFERYN